MSGVLIWNKDPTIMSSNSGIIEKWTTADGSLCFRFQERETFERPWILTVFAVLLVSVPVIEYFVKGSLHSLTPNALALFFIYLWWLTIPMRANEAVIEKTIHELMDDIVASDAEVAGTEVAKSRIHYDTKGTYATLLGQFLLVLLKNDQVWEYPIIYHNQTEKEDGYYECKREYVISDNQDHIRAIKPRGWWSLVERTEVPDKIKLWALILAIVVVGGLVFAGGYWAVMRHKGWVLLPVGVYVVVYGIIKCLARLWPGKTMTKVERIVPGPILLVYVIVGLMQPFIDIVGTYLFVALYAFGIPSIVLKGVSNMGWLELRPETIVFIVLALGSVLCSTYAVTKRIIRFSPLKNWGNHEYEFNREQLAFYLVHPSNMVFLVYLIYFVYLAVSGFRLIQCENYLFSETIDAAILKAFLVYIAYTNMIIKAKETEIDAKVLLQRIAGLFIKDR